METWIVLVMVLAVVAVLAGWAGLATARRRGLEARRDRWRELEGRFDRVTLAAERYDRDPGQALAAPGWLDRSSPVVRGFSGSLTRAVRDRAELERAVAPAPGRRGRDATADTAARLAPTEQDLAALELLVERVEDAYRDADRAVRSAGWSAPGVLAVPHHQFLLDPRWGRPAVLPRLGSLHPRDADRSVKAFLDCAYPLRRDRAAKALRERAEGPGAAHRAQRALDRLVATGRYTTDRHGFLWPASTVVEHWGVHRLFGRGAELSLDDAPPVEIANLLWSLLAEGRGLADEDLLAEAREALATAPGLGDGIARGLNEGIARGVQALPEGVRRAIEDAVPGGAFIPRPASRLDHRLREGLDEALVTGRLQRAPDGRIHRLRTRWPSTYRR
ncbi:hypothetical protein E7744_10685 [Citricoccus sp. SGAir0253]|uniref:hypothetical protein n=1 Tax=Citricoccus sp. SGAir0253 TaxID=2567881 RepID=UPI0010CCD62E|nr:hypothetical protein [Citricoccus sp. SGAir0253]QCU78568.1 hypothetical protein E7744_10685 [Citricoccus sp. SGAir0253]